MSQAPKRAKRAGEVKKLRKATVRTRASAAKRELARKSNTRMSGPVAIWDGKPKRSSRDHDCIYDEL